MTSLIVTNIIEVELFGKRGRGRPKKPNLEGINHRMQIGKYSDMKGAALYRKE